MKFGSRESLTQSTLQQGATAERDTSASMPLFLRSDSASNRRTRSPNTITESYWDDAGVPGQDITGKARPSFFVSGNGDGGLIDLIAAASADFDHAATIRAIAAQAGIGELTERLQAIDAEARAAEAIGQSFDFLGAYDSQIGQDVEQLGLIDEMIGRLRPGVQLTLQTRNDELMSVKTSTLNRLAVYLVIKACERNNTTRFRHVVCPEVHSVNPPVGPGQSAFLMDCSGTQIAADKVIVRRGPDRNAARHPFEDVLMGFAAHHESWLKRWSADTLVPVLTDPAREYFRRLSQENGLPLPRYLQAQMAQHLPVRVQVRRNGPAARWTGDISTADAAAMWNERAKEVQIVCPASPADLGPAAFALARLAIHAERGVLIANVSAWQVFLSNLTTHSNHADDIDLPSIRAGAEASILNQEIVDLATLSSRLNAGMDAWVLAKIDQHLQAYFASGADPGKKVGFTTEPALRDAMGVLWAVWRASFNATPVLLGRFLRLVLCALDTDDSESEAQTIVGPMKLKGLIRATAVALAIATGWQAMTPNGTRPGNLSRQFDGGVQTGHACAADMINGEMMGLSAAKFMWRTHFVILPMENHPSGFLTLADTPLIQAEDGVPRLTEVDDRTNIVLTVDDAFMNAVNTGGEALTALLAQAEDLHYRRLNRGIERADG